MTNTDLISKLEDLRLDANALKTEIGRDDLIDSQTYYIQEVVRKIEDLLTALKSENTSAN